MIFYLLDRVHSELNVVDCVVINQHNSFDPDVLRVFDFLSVGTTAMVSEENWPAEFTFITKAHAVCEVSLHKSRTCIAVALGIPELSIEDRSIINVSEVADVSLDGTIASKLRLQILRSDNLHLCARCEACKH